MPLASYVHDSFVLSSRSINKYLRKESNAWGSKIKVIEEITEEAGWKALLLIKRVGGGGCWYSNHRAGNKGYSFS